MTLTTREVTFANVYDPKSGPVKSWKHRFLFFVRSLCCCPFSAGSKGEMKVGDREGEGRKGEGTLMDIEKESENRTRREEKRKEVRETGVGR